MSQWFHPAAEVRAGRLWGWSALDSTRRALTIVGGPTFTVGELWEAVEARSQLFAANRLRPGDRLCLLQENSEDFVLDVLAAFRLGVVVVPINTGLRGSSLATVLNDFAPCVLRFDAECSRTLDSARRDLRDVIEWPVGGDPGRTLGSSPGPPRRSEPHRGDPAVILLTSGTTGLPKGVVWPHEMALTVAEHTVSVMGYDENDTIYTCLPLFHINALFCALYSGLLMGAEIVIAKRFSASGYWSELRRYGATTTNMMGSIPAVLWQRPAEAIERQHRLRLGMVLPLPTERQRFEERFGFGTTEVYGSTDTGIPLGIPFGRSRPGSCGRPMPGWRVEVVDSDDVPVPDGTEGELVLRPERPYMGQAGYWRKPATTVEVTRNLWLHTGDIVMRDREGWFYYRGRGKDMIRVSGENVAPIQVETVLLRHPAVEEAAVYGMPSDLGEESVVATVVLRPGRDVRPEELRELCESDLPHFAVPRYIRFADNLPKTETAKVQKSVLQAEGLDANCWDGGRPRRQPHPH